MVKKKLVFHAKGTLFLDYFLKINDYRECKNTIILHGIELLILVKQFLLWILLLYYWYLI